MNLVKNIIFIAMVTLAAVHFVTAQSTQSISLNQGTNMAAAVSPTANEMVLDVMGRLWILPATGGTAVPITDEFGNARQPSWSPDGQFITFQAYWTGNWHIYTVARDGSQLTQITHGTYDHREPHWSPDGKSIAYASDEAGNYDIWQHELNTNNAIALTDDPFNQYGPAWSPTGTSLIYANDNPNEKGVWQFNSAENSHTFIQPAEEKIFGLSWSNDGSLITYNAQSFGASTLNYFEPNNAEFSAKIISEQDTDVFPFRVSWIDNEQFIYTADGHILKGSMNNLTAEKIAFQYSINISRPNYSKKVRSFDPSADLTIKGLSQPQLSPDGKSILLIMLSDVWIIDEQGKCTQVTNDKYFEVSPIWSPQGDRIAFLADRSGSFRLYLHDLVTGKEEELSSVSGTASGMSWAPQNDRIAVSCNFGPRLGRVFQIELATRETTAITPMLQSSVGTPSWSPDGQRIGFSILKPFSSLYREGMNSVIYYDIEGNNLGGLRGVDSLSLGVRAKDGPIWSPDGSYLASIASGRLWLFPVDSMGQLRDQPIRLTEELADNPSWSGDSREILYMATDKLRKIDIRTGATEDVTIEKTWERTAPQGKLIVHAGTLFDGINEELLYDVDVVIDGHRITSIRPHRADREEATYIDASQKFVMPGLIDGHSHQGSYEGEKLDRAWLSWGVTTTRDPASEPYDAVQRREARESGHTIGPRVFYTGSPIDGNRIYYPGASALASKSQIDLELKRAEMLDYDMIKTYVRLSDPLQRYVIDGAHAIGIPVSSHELYPAVAFGVDGIEHISGTSRRGYSAKLSSLSKAYSDVTSLIAQSGMTFTPTTGIYISYTYLLAQDSTPMDDARVLKFGKPMMINSTRNLLSEVRQNPQPWKDKFDNTLQMVRDIHQQGGLVTAGTDSPIIPYGFSLHMELEAYTHAGLSNYETLKTCTINAARLIHAEDDLGSLEVGKLADLLLLDENPMLDIRNTRSMDRVIVNGRTFTKEELMNN